MPNRIVQFVYKAPVVLVAFLAYLYAIRMIFNYREDTTNVTNAGFAIMASLAALSFSFARVVESDALKDRIMFAGERLLHGGELVLVASILKYFIIALLKLPLFADATKIEVALSFSIGMLAAVIFSNGVLFAHRGLRVLNDLLLLRVTRHKDWDDLL
jgi:hypothetical protein